MAVVQISKIQVRRGKKNSDSGIPQLSSAEFAWAIDSQELYIGNGSVAEGAPYVGNTKVLTEHDNLFELISSYQYAYTNPSISAASTPRSLQAKLDEYVSIADFGAVGDGSTDCVSAFESAFTQLFRNADSNYKKVLVIPNGEYLFSSDLTIPSNAIIKGETQSGTVLNIGPNNIRFITSQGLELGDFNSTNRPQDIDMSNLTVLRTTGQVTLSGIANSKFENIKFLGGYVLDSTPVSLNTEPSAVFWENTLVGTRVDNVKFRDCLFEGNSVSVKCSQTDVFDTSVRFENCKFFVCDTAIYISGLETQGNRWNIFDCEFEEIANQAFRSSYGQGTIIQRSKFKNVGNDNASSDNPSDVMVYFGEKIGNVLIDCTSDRQQAAGITTVDSTPSYSEVYNSAGVSFIDKNYSAIYLSDSFSPFAVFSALNKFTVINYCLKLGNHSRYGSLTITVGDDLAGEDDISNVSITDNYSYSPKYITSEGGAIMTNFEFNATLKGNAGDSGIETIVLSYKNPLVGGATGSISFDVAYGV